MNFNSLQFSISDNEILVLTSILYLSELRTNFFISNGCDDMLIYLCVGQYWFEVIPMNLNRTCSERSFDFEYQTN